MVCIHLDLKMFNYCMTGIGNFDKIFVCVNNNPYLITCRNGGMKLLLNTEKVLAVLGMDY